MTERPDLTKVKMRWVSLVEGIPNYYDSFREALESKDGGTIVMSEQNYIYDFCRKQLDS